MKTLKREIEELKEEFSALLPKKNKLIITIYPDIEHIIQMGGIDPNTPINPRLWNEKTHNLFKEKWNWDSKNPEIIEVEY